MAKTAVFTFANIFGSRVLGLAESQGNTSRPEFMSFRNTSTFDASLALSSYGQQRNQEKHIPIDTARFTYRDTQMFKCKRQ